jgi:hypothetical protein
MRKNINVYVKTWPLAARLFLTRLIFDPENGGDTFLRNVGSNTNYTAVSLKKATFIATSVRTSYPINF